MNVRVPHALHRLPLVSWLVVVWIALWGDPSIANVLGGVLAAGMVLALFPARSMGDPHQFRVGWALVFAGYFLVQLVRSSLAVAWQVVTPNEGQIREGIVGVPVASSSDAVAALVANSISLTPGTLTLDIKRSPATLYVHVLVLTSFEDARVDVQRFQLAALRAFGQADQVEQCRALLEAGGSLEGLPPDRVISRRWTAQDADTTGDQAGTHRSPR